MSIKASLTLRYTIALGLVASVLVVTHLTSGDRLESGRHDARLIDVSGMQRMLSQRIALLSIERLIVSEESRRRENAQKMLAAIERMANNHEQLKSDWRARAAEGGSVYATYLGENGIAVEVERYLDTARMLVDDRRDAADAARRIDEGFVLAQALDGEFLARLNAVVQRYTHEAQMHSVHLRRYETLTLAFGLAILLLEALLIFRPMVNRIVRCIRVLDEANEELSTLATAVSTNLRAPIVDSIGLIRQVDDALASGKVTQASAATRNVYSSMVTLDGVIEELLEVVGRQREAVMKSGVFGRRDKRTEVPDDRTGTDKSGTDRAGSARSGRPLPDRSGRQ